MKTLNQSTYDHIQDLVDEKIIKRELKGYKPEFAMTFVFPSEYKEAVHHLIKQEGKKHIVAKIIEEAVAYGR